MAAEAGEKLPAPELTVIAAALDGLAPPVTSNRDEQMRALWEGCIASLTEWTSRAFLLQGGSGSGKTTCVENLLYRLRLISKDLKAQANCRIDIVELNMLKMQAPNDLVTGLIRYFGLADVADIAGIREFLAQLDNSMLILAIENIDISLQNQGWIDSLNQICHLATIGEIVMIGVGRELIGLVTDIPVQQIQFPAYDMDQTRAVLHHMLQVAEVPANAIDDLAWPTCIRRLVVHPEEIYMFYHICSEALKNVNRLRPAPIQLGGGFANVLAELHEAWTALQEQISNQVMNQVLTHVELFRSNNRKKPLSSKLLDLVILKLVLRQTLEVPAEELMHEYNHICTEMNTQPKTYQQIKVMCAHTTKNGGMKWLDDALVIPPYPSFIMEKKFIEARAAALEIPEEEAPGPEA